jgi:hypothetical protein
VHVSKVEKDALYHSPQLPADIQTMGYGATDDVEMTGKGEVSLMRDKDDKG